jgi:hypothetical protein
MAPNNRSKTGKPHLRQALKILLHYFTFIWDDPAEILTFYRSAWTFRSIFAILTKPWILDISAPFAISELSIKTVQLFDLLMTHIKPQLPSFWNHRVAVSQSQLKLKAIGPVLTYVSQQDRAVWSQPSGYILRILYGFYFMLSKICLLLILSSTVYFNFKMAPYLKIQVEEVYDWLEKYFWDF